MISWQVYVQNGTQVPGEGVAKQSAFKKGVPHAAAHIWIWREKQSGIELLFQKCAPKVSYKVGLLDISAAGHVDIGESEMVAAVRELQEEIRISVDGTDLYFAGVEHYIERTPDRLKDELRYVYTLAWDESMELKFADGEVDGVVWIAANNPDEIRKRDDFTQRFVQHSDHYFSIVFSGIEGQRQLAAI